MAAWTRERCIEIIRELAGGVALETLLPTGGHRMGFFRVVDSDPALQADYVRAQEAKAEVLFEQIVSIADDVNVDPLRARTRIDARRYYNEHAKPRKFRPGFDVHLGGQVDLLAALAARRTPATPALPQDLPSLVKPHGEPILISGATDTESVDVALAPDGEPDPFK
jgi:hypothetical protein